MSRSALIAVLLTAAALASTPSAFADGDPASDVLLGQNVFLPYSPISQALQRQLYGISDAAARAGYAVRVALIGSRSDLGVVPGLFGRPAAYARFLSSELAGVVTGPVLVVMPQGFGLAQQGHALSVNALRGVALSPGTDGLGTAALSAVRRLAAASGHPLPASSALSGGGAGASSATVRRALLATAVLCALAVIAIAAALAARARRAA
jgi:hypothetical protein